MEIIVMTNCFPINVTPKDEMAVKQVTLFFILNVNNTTEQKTITYPRNCSTQANISNFLII